MISEPNRPLVSVIMPCYKMGRYIGEALASVAAQSYPHWEVLAVDDAGPEDGTRDAVTSFARTHASHRVELICHETNRGVSAARNTALRAARGEFVAFLDPDDLWLPRHLELHLEGFQSNPEFGASTCPAWIFTNSPDQRWAEPLFFNDWERKFFPYSLSLHDGIILSTVMVRRSAAGENLHFDETPELQHIEDWDLWLRLAQAEVRFALRDDPTCLYRSHPGGASRNKKLMFELMQKLARKHAALLFEYQWIVSGHLGHLVRTHEEQIRRLYAEPPDLVSRIIRKIRRWFRAV